MAALSAEKIKEIQRLYKEIGTYSGVAKAVGSSPATVKKYVTANTPATEPSNKTNFDSGKIGTFKVDFNKTLSLLGKLTKEEIEDIKNLWGEI